MKKDVMCAFRIPKMIKKELKKYSKKNKLNMSQVTTIALAKELGFKYIPEQYIKK